MTVTTSRPQGRRSRSDTSGRDDPGRETYGRVFAAFLGFLLLTGGVSQFAPQLDILVRLASLAMLVVACSELTRIGGWRPALPWVGLSILLVATVGFQLIPLPAALVEGLPGRSQFLADLRALGIAPATRVASVAPVETQNALFGCLPWIAAALGTAALPRHARRLALQVVICVACLSVLMAAFQYTASRTITTMGAGSSGRLFDLGQFSNVNHWGVFLAMTLPLVLCGWQSGAGGNGQQSIVLAAIASIFMIVGVLVSGSAMAMILMVLVIGLCVIVMYSAALPRILVVGLIAALAILLVVCGVVALTLDLELFDGANGAARLLIWKSTAALIPEFWPLGSGGDTLTRVYNSAETLQTLDQSFTNRAHNEYLGIVLEHGLPGILLMVLVAGMLGWAIIQPDRPGRPRPHRVSAGCFEPVPQAPEVLPVLVSG
jgi:O-antigen ligase